VKSRLGLILTVFVSAAAAQAPPLGLDLFMPVPEDNPLTPETIDLGRRLFSDRRLSRDESISCATCHMPSRAFSDARTRAVGVLGREGRRNAPALVNRGYGRAFFWDGRSRSLEAQVLDPISNPNEMDLPISEAATRVKLSEVQLSRALANYVRSIVSADSAFDRFVGGDRAALSAEAQLGLQVFRGKGRCVACHIGPNFTDERTHNTGVAWRTGVLIDEGAGQGAFKTPTLRDVLQTAPYMHDGSFATLEEVVDFYDAGGAANPYLSGDIKPANLTAEEKRALVSFLRALSGNLREGGR
jgi:cytochrome c peroxidase